MHRLFMQWSPCRSLTVVHVSHAVNALTTKHLLHNLGQHASRLLYQKVSRELSIVRLRFAPRCARGHVTQHILMHE